MRRSVQIAAVYVVAAGLGLLLGVRGVPPFQHVPPTGTTPESRLGWALREETPRLSPDAWAVVRADAVTVRESWPAPLRDVLALVTAVRGLRSDGQADWTAAEQLCRALRWQRCDRASLEQLRQRARP